MGEKKRNTKRKTQLEPVGVLACVPKPRQRKTRLAPGSWLLSVFAVKHCSEHTQDCQRGNHNAGHRIGINHFIHPLV